MGRVRDQAVAENEQETPPTTPEPSAGSRAPWRALALRDGAFLSLILLLALVTGFVLTMADSPHTATTAPIATTAPSNAAAVVQAARAKVYATSIADAGLMQPAVDQQGNIWVGEMTTNKLAR